MTTALTPKRATLDDLRAQIDAIDDSLHDLIMRRAGLAGAIARLKSEERGAGTPEGPLFRPAREAAVVRRLLARHKGAFPEASLVRIWREVMGALLRLQAPFSVALGGGAVEDATLKELTRDHFGAGVTMRSLMSSLGAIRAVAVGRATVAVVPYPVPRRRALRRSWWLSLAQRGAPRIVAALPALSRDYDPQALAVAKMAPEPSGLDRTLVVIRSRAPLASQKIVHHLNRNRVDGRICDRDANGRAVLLEIEGFVPPRGSVLQDMAAAFGIDKEAFEVIGAFAVPASVGGGA